MEDQELKYKLDNVMCQLDILDLILHDMSNTTIQDVEEWLEETRKCME